MQDEKQSPSDDHHDNGTPPPEELGAVATPEKAEAEEKIEKSEGRKGRHHREIERLKEQKAKLQEELDLQRDRYLRQAAEFDNYRKRSERDFGSRLQMSLAEFYLQLLPIVDDLERFLSSLRGAGSAEEGTPAIADPLINGVELILQNFQKVLESRGVTVIQSVGTPFDPARHEALVEIDGDGAEPHTVLDEHVKGYMLFDRILRPAKVIISK